MSHPDFDARINRATGLAQSLKQLLECARDLDHPGAQLVPAIFLATEIEIQLESMKSTALSVPAKGAND